MIKPGIKTVKGFYFTAPPSSIFAHGRKRRAGTKGAAVVSGDRALDKTNRINVLYDFYGPLLTDKQQTFLKCYFQDDYSLGEIAAEFEISRQAVYEHLKRAEQVLEDYELKLRLSARHDLMVQGLDQLERMVTGLESPLRERFMDTVNRLKGTETADAYTAGG